MKFVTAAEMQSIDRKATDEFGISPLILMENAGIALADEALKMAGSPFVPKGMKRGDKISIVCGKGNNGGDGFVAARHLHNAGMKPVVFYLTTPTPDKTHTLVNFKIIEKMKLDFFPYSIPVNWDRVQAVLGESKVIIDALFGIGITRAVEEPFKSLIRFMNESKVPILSADIPSGMNGDTGEIMGSCVRAKQTLTFGLPKKAFLQSKARQFTGKVIVADISIPKQLLV